MANTRWEEEFVIDASDIGFVGNETPGEDYRRRGLPVRCPRERCDGRIKMATVQYDPEEPELPISWTGACPKCGAVLVAHNDADEF